jgi:hypothetical protein
MRSSDMGNLRDMRSTHGGDRVTRTRVLRLSPCPTAPALTPTVLIHLHRCQGPLPLASLGHGTHSRGQGWGRMARGGTGHDPWSLARAPLARAPLARDRPAGPRPPRWPATCWPPRRALATRQTRAARPSRRAEPAGQDFRPPENRPANVPASPEQGAADVRPAASKGQICPAAGRHELRRYRMG